MVPVPVVETSEPVLVAIRFDELELLFWFLIVMFPVPTFCKIKICPSDPADSPVIEKLLELPLLNLI